MTEYETILVEQRGRVGWITLHRPEALNALNSRLAEEVTAAAQAFDADFIELARSVARHNGDRIQVKNTINRLAGSRFIEEKQYQA